MLPGRDLTNRLREESSRSRQLAQLDRVVQLGGGAERHREDHEVGTPGHTLRVGLDARPILAGDDARHRGAVRKLGSVLIDGTREEPLDDVLVPELGMRGVDPRVQHADGHAVAGRDVGAESQLQVRIGLIGTDRLQAPLVPEARPLRVRARDLRRQLLVLGLDKARPVVDADARVRGGAGGQDQCCGNRGSGTDRETRRPAAARPRRAMRATVGQCRAPMFIAIHPTGRPDTIVRATFRPRSRRPAPALERARPAIARAISRTRSHCVRLLRPPGRRTRC